jgi:hypothetical protein
MASWWARPSWQVLHLFGLWYKNQPMSEEFDSLLRAFSVTMPCPNCRKHCQEFLTKHPPLQSNMSSFGYTVWMHNVVNLRTGKPTMTQEQAEKHWLRIAQAVQEPVNVKNKNNNQNTISLFVFGGGLAVGIGLTVLAMHVRRLRRS